MRRSSVRESYTLLRYWSVDWLHHQCFIELQKQVEFQEDAYLVKEMCWTIFLMMTEFFTLKTQVFCDSVLSFIRVQGSISVMNSVNVHWIWGRDSRCWCVCWSDGQRFHVHLSSVVSDSISTKIFINTLTDCSKFRESCWQFSIYQLFLNFIEDGSFQSCNFSIFISVELIH